MTSNAVNIVGYSEVIDSWGAMTHSDDPYVIANRLQSPQDWSDDMLFADEHGNQYFVEDLIGRTVQLVNGVQILVESAYDEELNSMLGDDFNDYLDDTNE